MVINGVEFEFDVNDVELMEKVEKNIREKFEDLEEKETYAESIRYFCTKVFEFFDETFGEGMAVKLFGTKVNYKVCSDALLDFREQYDKAVIETNQELHKRLDKYSPNRVARRSAKK